MFTTQVLFFLVLAAPDSFQMLFLVFSKRAYVNGSISWGDT